MEPLPDDLLDRVLAAAGPAEYPPALGRYRLATVLGRGGSGVVWLAHDADLDRPVAVKLLHPEYELSGELVRRFRAEGRTGGRLQHPGIAPVYDLGTTPDGRPFLVMKLLAGRTLAQVFATRPSTTADRPALLGLFVQLCQAVAYAHAAGVVHRDLKPGNVMVGPFGEVQVMDWGLAKTVGSATPQPNDRPAAPTPGPSVGSPVPTPTAADTRSGSVFGTPPYMAPEQANRAADADTRADVYSRGAVLLELLTGDPPPVRGGSPVAPVDPAALAARLEGVAPPLARLTLACLAVDPADRPADGGAVAAAMTGYLGDVQDRLAAAELAERTARVEARERRRRQRLWAGLAATVVVAAGAGGWVWADRRRAEAADERAVLGLLADADQALAAGRRGEAELAVRTADGRAQAATPVVRQRVAERLADIRMLDRLAEVRLMRGRDDAGRVGGPRRRDREGLLFDRAAGYYYRAAFNGYGLDPLADGAADRVRRSAIAPALVAALDAWAVNAPDPAERAALLATAAAADPDPDGLPARVRRAVAAGGKAALVAVADTATPDQPPAALAALARVLRGQGEAGRAVAMLRPARDRRPADYWLNLELAAAALAADQPAEAWRAAAESLAGGSAEVDLYLGKAAFDAGKLPAAEAALRRARAAAPDSPLARLRLGVVLNAQGKVDDGRTELEAATAADPADPLGWYNLGIVRQLRPATQEAAADAYRRAVDLAPDFAEAWNNLGNTLTSLNRLADAEAALSRAVAIRPGYATAEYNLGVLFSLQGRAADAVAAYRRAIAARPDHPEAHYNLARVLVYDQGKFGEAGTVLAASRGFAGDPGRWDRLATQAAKLGELDAALAGPMPTDPVALRERAELLAWPHCKRYTAAADWCAASFAATPDAADDDTQVYRQFAAGCAARAAAGLGTDSDPSRAAELRERARGWLVAALTRRAADIGGTDPAKREAARKVLRAWLTDPDLASVRDPAALPAPEQAGWAALWAQVSELTAVGR